MLHSLSQYPFVNDQRQLCNLFTRLLFVIWLLFIVPYTWLWSRQTWLLPDPSQRVIGTSDLSHSSGSSVFMFSDFDMTLK